MTSEETLRELIEETRRLREVAEGVEDALRTLADTGGLSVTQTAADAGGGDDSEILAALLRIESALLGRGD